VSHGYSLLLFYSVVLLAAADLYAIVSRFLYSASDSIAWGKTTLAVVLQVVAAVLFFANVYWLSATKRKLFEPGEPYWWSLSWRVVPMFAAVVIASVGYQLLYNAWNCGTHPFPMNRATTTCPR
jgi:hypothetical protein